ncbi:DUF397 domain-containing protein [Streptomyces sp. H10-C2]|uniref:DUF397 domain-containing protein n=1 Tax=unclassified Streptomyces TaxID=2593676 RepID=UPI0024BAC770|nr:MULTISPECIES: DUF397 domain-containing protein [unclassified Streptomyces]MDJ0341183.1 DUF397 domain-containing protein [Streptomyces sp. PH10-H1]MDJ0369464.1 DUF397 domain-containing protein [Streptomyces sp. H10-C2]
MPVSNWQKSSYCGEGNNCIELATVDMHVVIRESTAPAAIITTTPARVRAFLEAVKAGSLDSVARGI